MSLLEFKFVITEAVNCPIYKKGDYFELSGVAVSPPAKRKVCVFPVKIMADILSSLKGKATDSYSEEIIGTEFNCGGCTGIIKFVCEKRDEGWCVPQFRMLKEFEARKAMAEKMTVLEGQLKDFAMLSCLDESSLKDFISCAEMQEFPSGHTILRIDNPGKNLFLLLSGKVVLLDRQGETIGYLGKGEVFGEMSLMFNRLVNVTVKSVEPVKVLVINDRDFNQLLLKFPFIKMELARIIAKRLSNSNVPVSKQTSAGLNGRLRELPAPELFQMIHENMKNGIVELTLPDGSASVEFVEGEIIDSKYHDKTGKEAFYSIIMEKDGSFIFNTIHQDTSEKRQPIGGFMSMLMEGLRLMDEKESTGSMRDSTVAQIGATEQ